MDALPEQGCFAEFAIDGNLNTYARTEFPGPWDFTIDLQTKASGINRIVFSPDTERYASEYKIQISDDNWTWIDLVVQSNGTGNSCSYEIFPEASGRYIKITVAAQSGLQSHIIRNVEVFGYAGEYCKAFPFDPPERPEIIFKLIVGRDTDFLWKYRYNPEEIFARFDRVYQSVQPLLKHYNLSFVICPSLFYSNTDDEGYGREVTPVYTIDPVLISLLDEFEARSWNYSSKDCAPGFHLMVYSSDASHQQEEFDIPWPPLNRAEYSTDGHKGMTLDIQTARDLKFRYPRTFCGIVFHELLGSNRRWLNGGDGGIPKDDEAIRAWADFCRDYGLELVWGDPKWTASGLPEGNSIFVNDSNYTANTEIWADVLAYTRTACGSNAVFVINNNNFNLADSLMRYGDVVTNSAAGVPSWLQFNLPFKQHPVFDWAEQGFRWGQNLQDWFWRSGVKNYATVNWIQNFFNPCMPMEIVSAGMAGALAHNASVIYLESPGYFWHGPVTTPVTVSDEYEPTYQFHRFVNFATNIQNDISGTNGINFYFDSDTQRMSENSLLNPPDNYDQSTLIFYRTDVPALPQTFDCYNGKIMFHEHAVPSVPVNCFTDRISRVVRLENYGCGLEGLLVERLNNRGRRDIEIHALNGHAKFYQNDARFNTDFVYITAANLISEKILQNRGDLDELIVLRNESGALVPYVYQLYLDRNHDYRLSALTEEESIAVVTNAIGGELPSPEKFLGLVVAKHQVSIKNTNTRPLDRLVILTANGTSCRLQTKQLFKNSAMQLDIENHWLTDAHGHLHVASMDINRNFREEVVLIQQTGDSHIKAVFYEAGDSKFKKIHSRIFPVEPDGTTDDCWNQLYRAPQSDRSTVFSNVELSGSASLFYSS
ncbi:MAG: discoidin domain-containing protein [Kiritimatiellales bacterium]